MIKKLPILLSLAATFAFTALPVAAQKPSATGGTVVASEAGKAAIISTAEVTATVVAIDKATRKVTLKGPEQTVDVVAGKEVRNFDQIHVGDLVVVQYQLALSLELRKTRSSAAPTDTMAAVRAKPGEQPAGAVGREIHALADVVKVDPKNSIISLKGPRGDIVDLHVQNKDHFKVVKTGDQVDVTYTEAMALSVRPAKKPATKGK